MNLKLVVAYFGSHPLCQRLCWLQAPNPPKSFKSYEGYAECARGRCDSRAKGGQNDRRRTRPRLKPIAISGGWAAKSRRPERKQDLNRIDDLNKKIDQMATKLGPDYVALISKLDDIDPDSKEAQEITSALEGLDKLCAK
jgi:hypothetical protein